MNFLEENFSSFVDIIAMTQVKTFKYLSLNKNQRFLEFTARIQKHQEQNFR